MKLVLVLVLAAATAAAADRPPTGAIAKLDHQVASVDRIPIWQSELDELFERAQLKTPTPEQRTQALDTLIEAAILEHAARALQITTDEKEIDMAVEEIKKQNSIDDAGLDKALAEQHFTRDMYRVELARQLRAQKVYRLVLVAGIDVTDVEIKAAYDKAKAVTPGIDSFDKVKDVIKQRVWEEKLVEAQARWMTDARKKAHIVRKP
jgi:peptidyl-prolyl cis-trans isomerase SurA